MQNEYVKFSEGAVESAMQKAQSGGPLFQARALGGQEVTDVIFSIRAQCISVTVNGNGVCVELPFGLGKVCIPLPGNIAIGTVAQACLDIYYKSVLGIKIPAGVEVVISVAGQELARVRFGL